MLALSMTANGAKGETLAQMEALLGGDIPMETLNEYLYSYIKTLPSEKTAKLNIVGADVNELAPMLDQSGTSTAMACKVLRELLLALAANR